MTPDTTAAQSNILHMADTPVSTRRVFVRDYVTDAEIGVWSYEKGKTQKVRINVDLRAIERSEHHSDQLENVVCYNEIVLGIQKIIAEGHIQLVETLAEKIAVLVLENDDVLTVKIGVEKLEAVKEAESVGVEIERHR